MTALEAGWALALPLVADVVAEGEGVASGQVVGGVVRDALRGRLDGHDVDLVVEGDAVALGRRLLGRGGELVVHDRFGTATWRRGGDAVDLITARRETYPRPGALPETVPADLAADLGRRDFTVNAMAWQLWPGRRLIDPHGGAADLERGLLRVLHPGSFFDDPTRMFRAARYAARLHLELEPHTAEWMRAACEGGALQTVSPARLGGEWRRLAAEPEPADCVERLLDWGVGQRLGLRRDRLPALRRACVGKSLGADLLLAVVAPSGEPFGLSGQRAQKLAHAHSAAPVVGTTDEALVGAIEGRSDFELAVLRAVHPEAAPAIDRGVALRDRAPLLTGRQVLELGVAAGPAVGELLRAVRAARLRGEVTDVDGARDLVRAALATRGGTP